MTADRHLLCIMVLSGVAGSLLGRVLWLLARTLAHAGEPETWRNR